MESASSSSRDSGVNAQTAELTIAIKAVLNRLDSLEEKQQQHHQDLSRRLATLEQKSPIIESPRNIHDAREEPDVGFTEWRGGINFDDEAADGGSSERNAHLDRRKSFFMKNMEDVEKIVERKGQLVTFFSQQPDFSKIRLDRLGVKESFYFFKAINEYYLKYRINLPVGTLLSTSVRGTLASFYRAKRVTSDKIYGMSGSELLQLVQNYVQPTNEAAFIANVKSIVRFRWSGAQVNFSNNFNEFYDAILEYSENFRALVEYMSDGNNPDAIPRVNNSEKYNGLIWVYFSKFPKNCGVDEYPRNVMATLKREYATVDEFLDAFRDKLDNTKQRAKESMEELHTLGLGGSQNKGSYSGYISSGTHQYSHNKPKRVQDERDKLNAIEQQEVDAEYDGVDGVENDADRSISEDDFEEDAVVEEPEKPEKLSAMADITVKKPAKERLANGCFSLLYYGECGKGESCNRSHDVKVLKELHSQVTKLLRNSKYAPETKLERPAFSSNAGGGRTDVRPRPSFISNKMLNVMEEVLMLTTECVPRLAPMHANGVLKRHGSEVLVSCLFDTGASHANYISEDFVRRNRSFFLGGVRQHFSKVLLGDSVSTVEVKGRTKLELQFQDGDFVCSALVDFNVIQHNSNDIVIGLPTSCKCFPEFFLRLFSGAIQHFKAERFGNMEDLDYGSNAPGLMQPWSGISADSTAPEDEETPLPVTFGEVLHYMEMSPEQAMEEFVSQIPGHVSEGMRNNTDIVNMLTSWGYKAFIPQNWTGINGLEPFSCEFKAGMPEQHRPPARPVNPRLYEHAKKEFERLSNYFYVPSESSVASCLVIAPKATKPFIRFCGDYVWINSYIVNTVRPIPNVRQQIERVKKFKLFFDIDMANSFHQILLSQDTSEKLSVQTPWGLVRPLFMPEGIGPASGMLQHVVYNLFKDFEPWCICIFDNILILANDYADGFGKLCSFLRRCIERNVYMKFSKSWLGFGEVTFFGYKISNSKFSMTEERKLAISSLPFPANVKKMQSFLGAALYFMPFVPNFAALAAPMYDMTRKDFNWDESTWIEDFKEHFNTFIKAVVNSLELYYPDYELPWFVRTDACNRGIGGGLYQEVTDEDGKTSLQPIGFVSKKFSAAAYNWATIEQECFGIYYTVKHFSYYLRGKPFILQTDHNNLLWIGSSDVPKIIRWRVYLQGFAFLIQHIPGKQNVLADYLSRSFDEVEELTAMDKDARDSIINQVHNGRMGHVGVRRTWHRLNHYFPGHKIPYRVLEEYVMDCPLCQQDRKSLKDKLQPVVRHLKVDHLHSTVGVDCLAVTPADIHGNKLIIVIVVFFTKYVYLHPAKEYTAVTMATALFKFFCTFGLFDKLISDPGSNLTADAVQLLNKWLGIRHVLSLVDRHESNGVEGSNKQILRHLRALVTDERVRDRWSDDTVLPIVALILNSEVNSETGYRPLDATFGSHAATYHQVPSILSQSEATEKFIATLNENLKTIAEASVNYQQSLVEKRTKDQQESAQNMYQQGDFVLFDSQKKKSKLSLLLSGPYEVIQQVKNDVECRHLVMGNIVVLHVERLQLFRGTREDAVKMARIDADQMSILSITGYQGDPRKRSTLTFETVFADGDVLWLPWSQDISTTLQFEDFCREHAQLNCLLFSAKEAQRQLTAMNKSAIKLVKPGDTGWADLRSFGEEWYVGLNIPDKYHTVYLVEVSYRSWGNKAKTEINAHFPVFGESYSVDHYFVFAYGSMTSLPAYAHKIVDEAFVKGYPEVLPEAQRHVNASEA